MKKRKPLYDKEIAEIYDSWVTSGYYDYPKESKEIKEIIGKRKTILELGIGTGNIAILLAKKGCQVDGIDTSPYMLNILAKKLKKEKVTINYKLQDMNQLKTTKKYDVVLSKGGGFWFVLINDNLTLDGYSTNFGSFKKMQNIFQRVFESLKFNGLFLINVQYHGEHFELKMPNEIKYWFDIKNRTSKSYIKIHHFERNGKIFLKKHICIFRYYNKKKIDSMAEKIGFKVIGLSKTKNFYIFKKIAK